jgi:hypothetical protein
MSQTNDNVEWSAVFKALSASRRREILRYAAWETKEVGVEDMVHHLTLEAEDSQSEEEQEVIATRLHHVDIPMLVDANLVQWDKEQDILQPAEAVFQLPVGLLSPVTMSESARVETGVVSD